MEPESPPTPTVSSMPLIVIIFIVAAILSGGTAYYLGKNQKATPSSKIVLPLVSMTPAAIISSPPSSGVPLFSSPATGSEPYTSRVFSASNPAALSNADQYLKDRFGEAYVAKYVKRVSTEQLDAIEDSTGTHYVIHYQYILPFDYDFSKESSGLPATTPALGASQEIREALTFKLHITDKKVVSNFTGGKRAYVFSVTDKEALELAKTYGLANPQLLRLEGLNPVTTEGVEYVWTVSDTRSNQKIYIDVDNGKKVSPTESNTITIPDCSKGPC